MSSGPRFAASDLAEAGEKAARVLHPSCLRIVEGGRNQSEESAGRDIGKGLLSQPPREFPLLRRWAGIERCQVALVAVLLDPAGDRPRAVEARAVRYR